MRLGYQGLYERPSLETRRRRKRISHIISSIWALISNAPLYGSKLDEILKNLKIIDRDIHELTGSWSGITIITLHALLLLGFELGNETRYADSLRYALYDDEHALDDEYHSEAKNSSAARYYDIAIKIAGASVRTYLNGASVALLMQDLYRQEGATIPVAALFLVICGVNNFAYYLCKKPLKPWMPPQLAKALRFALLTPFAIGPSALFATSAIRKMHFDHHSEAAFAFNNVNNGVVTAGSMIGGTALAVATLTSYNHHLANFLGETKEDKVRRMPRPFETLKKSRSITWTAATFKALVSTAAAYQVIISVLGENPLGYAVGISLAVIGFAACVLAQYGLYKPVTTKPRPSASLGNVADAASKVAPALAGVHP